MKKVLIVAHDFPPHGGGGVLRVLKFTKYLPEFGWKPIILTVQPEYYRRIDKSLVAEIPSETQVVRTGSYEPKGRSYQKALNTFHGSAPRTRNSLRALRQKVYGYFLVHQDEDFLWLPQASRAATRILREQNIDAMLTSSPPHCVQWLGVRLSKRYGVPWVADLRDSWIRNPLFHARFPPRRWTEERMERALMRHAKRILVATPPIRDDLVQHYPGFGDKVQILTNGYDPADFVGYSVDQDPHHLDLVYVGSMDRSRRPMEPLFQAIAQLIKHSPELREILRLRFVGSFGPAPSALVQKYGLDSIVESTGWVEHRDAIQHMLNADVLLIISSKAEGGKEVLTGKLFEYIATENLILVLAPQDAAVSQLVQDDGLGIVASPTDVDQISAAIQALYHQFKAGTLVQEAPSSFKQSISRVEQTRTLANILTEVTFGDHP